MSETIWVAAIAVFGTALGAAISPVVDLVSKSLVVRADEKSERIQAVAEYCSKLRTYAQMTKTTYESWNISRAHAEAVASRFEVAKHIPRGAGAVDRFCADAIATVAEHHDRPSRLLAADHAADSLLSWARGDLRPRALLAFDVQTDAEGTRTIVRHSG